MTSSKLKCNQNIPKPLHCRGFFSPLFPSSPQPWGPCPLPRKNTIGEYSQNFQNAFSQSLAVHPIAETVSTFCPLIHRHLWVLKSIIIHISNNCAHVPFANCHKRNRLSDFGHQRTFNIVFQVTLARAVHGTGCPKAQVYFYGTRLIPKSLQLLWHMNNML